MDDTIPADRWSVDSNEVLQITQIDPNNAAPLHEPFEPLYTYPLYGEAQTIFGYDSLSIDLLFAADDMEPCVLISEGNRVPQVGEICADKVDAPLREIMPECI